MSDPSHLPRDHIDTLVAVMAHLRDPQSGCPWDLAQDFASVAPYTIEEAYEVADAIERNALGELRDELGDLLLQVVFHARMAEEQGAFAFADVVASINDKMIRRHPHVFGDEARRDDAEAQLVHWETLKRAERMGGDDRSLLAGIARGLPEWQRAVKLQKRAASVGFDWPSHAPVIDKLHEEIEEVRVEFDARSQSPEDQAVQARLEDEIGDLLFVSANLARHAKVDVGRALRRANAKFERRFRAMEAMAEHDGTTLEALDLDAQDALWNRAKAAERGG